MAEIINRADTNAAEFDPTSGTEKDVETEASIKTTLKFVQWQHLYESEKPFQIFINIPDHIEDRRTTNLVFQDRRITIQDVRDQLGLNNFTLDTNGFTYLAHRTILTDFSSRCQIEDIYLPEIEALIHQTVPDIKRIFIFDWRLRKNAPEIEGSVIDLNDLSEWLRPALHVHIDQSPSAVLNRIRLQLPNEASHLLKGRVRVLNVWRSLIDAVEDYPLAIGDGSTFDAADLVETDHVRRHYTGSTLYVQYNPRQRFYYMSRQGRDDVLMFKNFDSERSVRAAYAPHASFQHPQTPELFTPRESIEVRALVFSDR